MDKGPVRPLIYFRKVTAGSTWNKRKQNFCTFIATKYQSDEKDKHPLPRPIPVDLCH